MRYIHILAINIIMGMFGLFSYAWLNQLIMIRTTRYQISPTAIALNSVTKKKVLFFWYQTTWCHEENECIWSTDTAANAHTLLNSWLSIAYENNVIYKCTHVATVCLHEQQEIFINFDRNPLDKSMSTFSKWMFIESLLKTLRTSDIKIQSVRFLVNHKPLRDNHLDFSKAWPLEGFL